LGEKTPQFSPAHALAPAVDETNLAKTPSEGLVQVGVDHGQNIRGSKGMQVEILFDGNHEGLVQIRIRRLIAGGHDGPR